MNSTDISLITPVLNERDTLQATLQSVAAQSLPPLEHIIVDSGSTDGSLDIIKEYMRTAPYSVKLLQTPAGGVYAALNEGSRRARGGILGLLHGNDIFTSPQVLEFIMAAMNRNPEVDLVYGDVHYINTKGQRTRYYSGAHFRPSTLHIGFAFPHPSMYVRRRLWERIGEYDLNFRIAADYEWIVRAVLNNNVKMLYLPLDMVAMHEGGLSTRWINRIFHNIPEKRRALKVNGHKAPLYKMLGRYLYLFKY